MFENTKINYNNSDDYWKLPTFNGIGLIPQRWSRELQLLTGQTGLTNLTLVPLRGFLSSWNLISHSKKWCPLCLNEENKIENIYGQLLWEFEAVNSCPKHGVNLVSSCGCKYTKPQFALNIIHLPGICKACGRSLAKDIDEALEIATPKEIEIAKLIADMLGDRSIENAPTVGVAIYLKRAVDHFSGGNAAQFARMLGIRRNVLHGWLHGHCMPIFSQIINIAWRCGTTISNVFLGDQSAFRGTFLVASQVQASSRPKPTKTYNTLLIKKQLEIISSQKPVPSLVQIADQLDVSENYLIKKFREIVMEISMCRREQTKQLRLQQFESECRLFKQSAENILKRGRIPTHRLMITELAGRVFLFKKKKQDTCKIICKEVSESAQQH
jgi:hypothetical protein